MAETFSFDGVESANERPWPFELMVVALDVRRRWPPVAEHTSHEQHQLITTYPRSPECHLPPENTQVTS